MLVHLTYWFCKWPWHKKLATCVFFLGRCYWGYAFENLATENSTETDIDGKGIDANVEFCSVIKTKLGAHRIIMGAEMDCCDSTDDGRRFYVELKTSREVLSYSIIFFAFQLYLLIVFLFCLLIYLSSFLWPLSITVGLSYRGEIWEREVAEVLGKFSILFYDLQLVILVRSCLKVNNWWLTACWAMVAKFINCLNKNLANMEHWYTTY